MVHFSRVPAALQSLYDEEVEDRSFDVVVQRWAALLPHMVVNTTLGKKPPLKFVPLHKYLSDIKSPRRPQTEKSAQDIIKDVTEVIKYNARKGGK